MGFRDVEYETGYCKMRFLHFWRVNRKGFFVPFHQRVSLRRYYPSRFLDGVMSFGFYCTFSYLLLWKSIGSPTINIPWGTLSCLPLHHIHISHILCFDGASMFGWMVHRLHTPTYRWWLRSIHKRYFSKY